MVPIIQAHSLLRSDQILVVVEKCRDRNVAVDFDKISTHSIGGTHPRRAARRVSEFKEVVVRERVRGLQTAQPTDQGLGLGQSEGWTDSLT